MEDNPLAQVLLLLAAVGAVIVGSVIIWNVFSALSAAGKW